ncbi:GIY-YIG nuclease family protein [Patescibacteria group bacterium]|nr:GIY-YIG nuclease family protein [Patescibacteria group bacterium]MBU1895620.1 GIY-YIG nuclease family protein [Patescibacteria group bacterium]
MINKIQKKIKTIPNKPGIYLFYNKNKELVYVGKATSLKNRVRSYFVGTRTSRPIEQFIDEVVGIRYKETDSVLEAIILEANYIKKFLPKYNVEGRDDKSWNYIVITKDEYPSVETMRAHDFSLKHNSTTTQQHFANVFGPYPGLNTKATMKLLQRLFFISICQKARNKKQGTKNKPCFYYQMGQCLGVCTGEISSTDYKRKVIRPLVTFLKGGKKRLISILESRMKKESGLQNFEEAGRLRNQIKALQRIHDVALLNRDFFRTSEGTGRDLSVQHLISRVEGYDISNLGATGKVGGMVVFENGKPDKSRYRKFRIKTVEGQSDVDCLAEVLERRLKHVWTDARSCVGAGCDLPVRKNKDFWPLPNLFLIDGGKPQVNRVKKVLCEQGVQIPVVGIAKGSDRKKNEFILAKSQEPKIKSSEFAKWVRENKDILIAVRDEAHRFAIAYQRKLRRIR